MTQIDIPTGPSDSALALTAVSGTPTHARWRTEAMRRHSTPRLLVINRGQGRIVVRGLTSGYTAKDLIFLPARTLYGFEAGPGVFAQLLTLPRAMATEWPSDPVHLRLRDGAAVKELRMILAGLEGELSGERPHATRAAHYHAGLLSVFFHRQSLVQDRTVSEVRTETAAARIVAAFADLVERDFGSSRGIADYAAELGITPTHLSRCCRLSSGQSALALLSDRRHFEACRLLRDTSLPLTRVAKAAGYGSAAYFSRVFHGRTGQAPSRFRKTETGAFGSRPSGL